MVLYQVSQERFRRRGIGLVYTVASTWLDCASPEAANREFRLQHKLREGDWVLVKNLESCKYESKIFS